MTVDFADSMTDIVCNDSLIIPLARGGFYSEYS